METEKKVITLSWLDFDVRIIAQSVKRLQNRIVNAKKAGRDRLVKKLQKLLVKSLYARVLAVKRVSENRGKKTAGVDKELLDNNGKKMRYVKALKIDKSTYQAMPLKRVEIPKKNGKTRPLGIPTMFDRCVQALYKLAIEPIAEIVADYNSYGFRAKRSTQDAMKQIWLSTCRKNSREWVLEGDIKGCFDNISHKWLYDNIPLDKHILKQWLKSGFVKNQELFPTTSGTPQGGIISPILANMVLDGIEEIVNKHNIEKRKMTNGISLNLSTRFHFIRYADDWVVIGESPKHLRVIQKEIETFLALRGLSLSKEKTHISNIRDGFNFLGFHFRKYSNDKMIIKPTKEGIKSLKSKIKDVFKKYRTATTKDLINKLNPIIRGWAYYYRFVNSKKIFGSLDKYIWQKSFNWMNRIHQRRQTSKYYPKYFKKAPNSNSDVLHFAGKYIFRMSAIPIVEYIKVQAKANPFDKEFDTYFTNRFFTLKNLTSF